MTEDLERKESSYALLKPGEGEYGACRLEAGYVSREDFEKEVRMLDESGKNIFSVNGVQCLMLPTYDPDTWDPDIRMPWTPEPEPGDPEETYTAWGRKHFGEEWYEQRKIMIQERNFYMDRLDPVFLERLQALRILEHKIERRPFAPYFGLMDKRSWKPLWARLSKNLPSAESGSKSTSPKSQKDSNTKTKRSKDDKYNPTPKPREPSPCADDPRKPLTEGQMYWKIFLKEDEIDKARNQRDIKPGEIQLKEKEEEIGRIRYFPGSATKRQEYGERMSHFRLRAQGWTEEQVAGRGLTEERFQKTARSDQKYWDRYKKRHQRKIYIKERASRRLAGALPEFGLLPAQKRLKHNHQPAR